MDWTAVGLTAKLAACTTAVLALVGLPLSYWLATTRWRGKFLIEAAVTLPLVLPPTVLGFYLLFLLGPHSLFGQAAETITGGSLLFTFPGILIGAVLCNLPFAVQPFTAGFATVDRRLVEASWCLGVSRTKTFFRIMVPLAWPSILTGLVLAFAHTVGEFGVVLMVGGNIEGVTRTLSIAIYDDVQQLKYAEAQRTALLLLSFAFVALCVTRALQRRRRLP